MNRRWTKIGKEISAPHSLNDMVRELFGPRTENMSLTGNCTTSHENAAVHKRMTTESPTKCKKKPGRKIKKFAEAESESEIPVNAEPEPEIPVIAEPEPEIPVNAEPEPEIPANARQQPEIPGRLNSFDWELFQRDDLMTPIFMRSRSPSFNFEPISINEANWPNEMLLPGRPLPIGDLLLPDFNVEQPVQFDPQSDTAGSDPFTLNLDLLAKKQEFEPLQDIPSPLGFLNNGTDELTGSSSEHFLKSFNNHN